MHRRFPCALLLVVLLLGRRSRRPIRSIRRCSCSATACPTAGTAFLRTGGTCIRRRVRAGISNGPVAVEYLAALLGIP